MLQSERAEMSRLRIERNLTYTELAAQIGITMHTLYRVLARNGQPNERTEYRIRLWLSQQRAVA